MHYHVTDAEKKAAKVPHHIFNINILVTHLAISQVALELGHGNPWYFLLVPAISSLVIAYIYFNGQKVIQTGTWFIAAHWKLAWRRSRNLLISYVIAIAVISLSVLLGNLFGGGLMMNDFSDEGSSTSIVQKIGTFFGAVVVFVTVLYNFLQTGISVYDAGKGIIDEKISRYLPRDQTANQPLDKQDSTNSQPTQTTVDKNS